jgi:hypothetical protein
VQAVEAFGQVREYGERVDRPAWHYDLETSDGGGGCGAKPGSELRRECDSRLP